MFEFLKTKNYMKVFNFLIGVFLVIVLRPTCKDDSCITHVNPDINEINMSTYHLGSSCYQFRTNVVT